MANLTCMSSVIRQNGESQNGCFKKTKHTKFPKNEHFLPLDALHTCTCAYQGVRMVRFSENLACFVFLKPPFLRLILLSYYRRCNTINGQNIVASIVHQERTRETRIPKKLLLWKEQYQQKMLQVLIE